MGEERSAIEITMDGQTVYIDNDKDWALSVMLRGAAPVPRFRFMPVFEVKDEPNCAVFYKAKGKFD